MTISRERARSHLAISAAALAIGAPLILAQAVQHDAAPPIDSNPYRGTEGPLEVVGTDGTSITTGAAIGRVRAGSRFAWVTTLCVSDTSEVEMVMELTRTESPPRTIAWSDRHWPPGTLACLPGIGSMAVPRDAPGGIYELHRIVLLRQPHLPARSVPLPPLHISVEPPS